MSMLISSAAAGAKAPPKAPPRRRPPGPANAPPPPKPAPKAAAANPVPKSAVAIAPTGGAGAVPAQEPSSRPNTATQQVRFADTVTSIAPPRVTAETTTIPIPPARRAEPLHSATQDTTSTAVAETPETVRVQQQTPAPTQQEPSEDAASTEILQSPAPTAVMISSADEGAARPNKRAREAHVVEKPRKAPKRSSTRSNAAVQAHVEGVDDTPPARLPRAKTIAANSMTRDVDVQAGETVSGLEPQAAAVGDAEGTSVARISSVKGKAAKKPIKPRAKKAVKSAATLQDDDSGDEDGTARSGSAATPVVESQEPAAGDATDATPAVKATTKSKRVPKAKTTAKPAKKRQPRIRTASEELADNVATEEAVGADEGSDSDPELHEIDPNTLSMFQLTRQKRYGKTSKREQEMQAIDWDEVTRKRREAAEVPIATAKEKKEQEAKARAKTSKRTKRSKSQTPANGIAETIEGDTVEGADADDNADKDEAEDDNDNYTVPTETHATNTTVGFRIVNGEIVMDEDTLTLDRHALATAQIASDLHIADEASDLTLRVNNATHMNDRKRFPADRVPVWKAKSDPWSDEETDRFYEALRCWGTDFGIIAKLFPGKTRAMVKKKFGREERIEPERIDSALLGKVTPPPPSLTPGPTNTFLTPAPAPAERASMSLPLFAHQSEIPLSDLEKFPSLAEAEEAIKLSLKDKEEAMQVLLAEEAEDERQRAVMEETRKRVQEERERRKANGGNGKGRGRRVGREVGFGGC
ncbi:hypothetical protein LTR95_012691 [Oleoguttula sp. CCFEE 5521]